MKRVVMLRSNPIRPYPRLEKMANCLAGMGCEVTVLAWDRDDNYKPREERLHLKNQDVRIIRAGIKGEFSGGFKKNAIGLARFEIFILRWLIKHQKEYDIIHAYDFDCGYIASKVAKRFKKKLVYDIADYYVDAHGLKGSSIGRWVENREIGVINKADATVLCTEERIKQIERSTPKKVVCVHNTPDIESYETITEPVISSPTNRMKLVYVGILGLSRFIDKIAEVVSERNDCEFHIGGYGNNLENTFKTYAKNNDNIFFYGTLPYASTIELEKECDVMCAIYDPDVPNHKYAAPNKFYEALAIGKPLIMARHTGMAEIVEREAIGEVIDYSKEALNDAIDHLIKHKESWNEIRKRELRLYHEKYSWTKMEKRIHEMYSTL